MADEVIVRDDNKTPVIAGVNSSGEVRNVKTDDGGNITIGGYDDTNDASKFEVINPDWSKYDLALDVDVTNETNATTNRHFSMNGYNRYSIVFEVGAATDTTTLTVSHSNDNNSIVDSSKVYQDTTQYGHSVSTQAATAASYTADVITSLIPGNTCQTIKVETVTAGGNNDADYSIKVYRWNE